MKKFGDSEIQIKYFNLQTFEDSDNHNIRSLKY